MATGNNDTAQQMDKDIQKQINVFRFFYFVEYFLYAMLLSHSFSAIQTNC